MSGRPANTPEVLWSKVDVRGEDECWPWLGFRNAKGYGRTWLGEKGYYAHRVIFDLVNPGVITLSAPKQMQSTGFLMHSCDNPCCCNPKHLSVGTHLENMEDKAQKGRAKWRNSVSSPRAKLSRDDVIEVRRLCGYLLSAKEVAAVFGVSVPTIKAVRNGRAYADVTP